MVASKPAATLSLRLLLPFTRALVAAGTNPASLLDGLDFGPSFFTDVDRRIPHDVAVSLLERAARALSDPALGVHAAELVRPGDFDALEHVARASGTVRGALEAVSRYVRLMHDSATFVHVVEGDREAWSLTIAPPGPSAMIEFGLATLVTLGRTVIGRPETPLEVLFAHAKPKAATEHERVFGCPISWSRERNSIVFERAALDRVLSHVSPSLSLTLEQHASKLLAELPAARTHAARVREHIVAALRAGEPTSNAVARRLRLSERTLRRRLQEEGVTFSELLSDVRRDLSPRYLEDPSLSVAEIAFLLGFSDASAFQRAFRRWYGSTPSEHRRRAGGSETGH